MHVLLACTLAANAMLRTHTGTKLSRNLPLLPLVPHPLSHSSGPPLEDPFFFVTDLPIPNMWGRVCYAFTLRPAQLPTVAPASERLGSAALARGHYIHRWKPALSILAKTLNKLPRGPQEEEEAPKRPHHQEDDKSLAKKAPRGLRKVSGPRPRHVGGRSRTPLY